MYRSSSAIDVGDRRRDDMGQFGLGGHFAPARSSIRWKAAFGTRISLPIRMVGMSPRFAAS